MSDNKNSVVDLTFNEFVKKQTKKNNKTLLLSLKHKNFNA